MPAQHQLAMVGRLSRYLDRLFDRLGERVGDRVADRLEATLDVLTDPQLMDDLRRADAQQGEDARPYEEIARDRPCQGLASSESQRNSSPPFRIMSGNRSQRRSSAFRQTRLKPAPLLGKLSGRWRVRVGGYRIVYRIRENGRLVIVEAIRTRSRSY